MGYNNGSFAEALIGDMRKHREAMEPYIREQARREVLERYQAEPPSQERNLRIQALQDRAPKPREQKRINRKAQPYLPMDQQGVPGAAHARPERRGFTRRAAAAVVVGAMALGALGAATGVGVKAWGKHERAVAASEQKGMHDILQPFMNDQAKALKAEGSDHLAVQPAGTDREGRPLVQVIDLDAPDHVTRYEVMHATKTGKPDFRSPIYYQSIYLDGHTEGSTMDAVVAANPDGEAWAAQHHDIATSGPQNSYYGLHRTNDFVDYSWNTVDQTATDRHGIEYGDTTAGGYADGPVGNAQQIVDDWATDGYQQGL